MGAGNSSPHFCWQVLFRRVNWVNHGRESTVKVQLT